MKEHSYYIEVPIKAGKGKDDLFLLNIEDLKSALQSIEECNDVKISNFAYGYNEFRYRPIENGLFTSTIKHRQFEIVFNILYDDKVFITFFEDVPENIRESLNIIIKHRRYNIWRMMKKVELVVPKYNETKIGAMKVERRAYKFFIEIDKNWEGDKEDGDENKTETIIDNYN